MFCLPSTSQQSLDIADVVPKGGAAKVEWRNEGACGSVRFYLYLIVETA